MLLRRKYLFGTTVLAGVIAAAAPALAQTAQPQPANPRAAQQPAPVPATQEQLEEVIVTGTRIRGNSEFTSASPVQTITTEQTDLRGIPDAAQALLSSTLAVSSFQLNDQLTGYVTNGGGGTQSVGLRGIGTQRTLTLLNGRRAGPAGTRGQVQAFDLGVIPGSIVERSDILKDGASSIYGSDAVAGVINIITRRDLDGGAMNVFYSQPFEEGGEQFRADAAFGRTFDRGFINLGVDYAKTFIQRRNQRDYTSCTEDYLFDPETGARQDYIDPFTGEYKCYNTAIKQVSLLTSGFSITRANIPGYTYPTAAQGNNVLTGTGAPALAFPAFAAAYQGWARQNRAGYPLTYLYATTDDPLWGNSSIISPLERISVSSNMGYQITDDVELYGEFLFSQRESSQIGMAQVFQSFAQRNIVNGAANALPASNPNNPFGQPVQTVAPYESSSFQEVNYYRGVIGLRGTAGDWDWDVYGQYSLSDASYNNGPRIYLDRLLALNSPNVACTNTPAGGNFSGFDCSALPGGIPWTSERVLAGQFTDAERDFLFFTEDNTTTYDHMYLEGVISTNSLFSLPAGDVGAAFGAQIRREEIDDTPGAQALGRNVALYTTAGRTAGSDTILESFAELELPLLRDMPFADSLTLNVSGRLSRYDSYGQSDTYKAGLNWAVTPEYRLRASYGTSFRAPSLYEQFLGAQVGYGGQSANDPCYDYTNNATIDPVILAGCVADGASTTLGGSSVAISSVGGRALLNAETADNLNLGFVWTPSFMPLSVAIDYYEISIEDAVSQLGGFDILTKCYQGQTGYCGLYSRIRVPGADNGKLATVNNAYVNVNEINNRGIDLQIRFSEDTPLGRLTIESQHNFKLEDTETFEGDTSSYLNSTFNYTGPGYAGNLYVTLQRGDFSYFYGVDMIGRGSDVAEAGGRIFANAKYADLANGINSTNCALPATSYCSVYKYYADFYSTHSASVRYRNEDGWSVSLGIQNLWDEHPPTAAAGQFRLGTSALNGYDMRGRRASIRIGKTF
ncbi:TonB-dependent receptor plug domain-containing protein [Brevundimonas sp. NPDC092305]|uniref:TonB-dependent receptor plug domain-containing protein n=1 Tax=Brevundimonas sp. NPDC092305 TaxID=3363957 RepID=UPI003809BCDC